MILESMFFIPCITIFVITIVLSITLVYKEKMKSQKSDNVVNNYDYRDFVEPPTHIIIGNKIFPIDSIANIIFDDDDYRIMIITEYREDDKSLLEYDSEKEYVANKNYIIRTLSLDDAPCVK